MSDKIILSDEKDESGEPLFKSIPFGKEKEYQDSLKEESEEEEESEEGEEAEEEETEEVKKEEESEEESEEKEESEEEEKSEDKSEKKEESEEESEEEEEEVKSEDFSFESLEDDKKSELIKELTKGKASSIEELQDVLSSTENQKPVLNEQEQQMIAISRKAEELGLSTQSAISLYEFAQNVDVDKMSDKELILQDMIAEDIANGQDPSQTKKEFNDWFEDKYGEGAEMGLMERREYMSKVKTAKDNFHKLKNQFSDLKVDGVISSADTAEKNTQLRESFLKTVDESFKNPDTGKISFDLGNGEELVLSPKDPSGLKSKVENFYQELNDRWGDGSGAFDPAKIAKDFALLDNVNSLVKSVKDKAIVSERENIERDRKKVKKVTTESTKPKPFKGKVPKDWNEAADTFKVTPARL